MRSASRRPPLLLALHSRAFDENEAKARRMDLAGLHSFLHKPVIINTSIGTKFIGRLELIANSASTVTLTPLDAATAAQNDYAINGVPALDVNSIVFVQPLPI